MVPGQGLVLAVDDVNYTIYGIGPDWYWETLGVERPAVGEEIYVQGYIVDYNGVKRYIAMTIIVGGDSVQLRDPETGKPLWRGIGGGGK